MKFVALGHRLPRMISVPLFGDRDRYGRVPDRNDPSWIEWLSKSVEFYHANQRQSLGRVVNHAGYKIMRRIDFAGANVLEIGPGALDHIAYWTNRPAHFTCLDINASFIEMAAQRLAAANVAHAIRLYEPSPSIALPFGEASFDVVLAFYSLEHVHPIAPFLDEVARVLKPNGVFAGAIPCEGGLAWGLGRYMTSRQWLLRNTQIDPDRIICWEHPNFADTVLDALQSKFKTRHIGFWPLHVPVIDINLIAHFAMVQGA